MIASKSQALFDVENLSAQHFTDNDKSIMIVSETVTKIQFNQIQSGTSQLSAASFRPGKMWGVCCCIQK
jgi:hypothetical protein